MKPNRNSRTTEMDKKQKENCNKTKNKIPEKDVFFFHFMHMEVGKWSWPIYRGQSPDIKS